MLNCNQNCNRENRWVRLSLCAYCHSVGAFSWTVVGSLAGVVGTAAVIVVGVLPFLRNRQQVQPVPEVTHEAAPTAVGGEVPMVVGDVPQEPPGFQPRAGLLAALDGPGVVVYALTGMRGVGKTQLAAAYARARLADRWRLVAWVNAEDTGTLLAGVAEVAAALGLAGADAEAAGRALRHRLEIDGERCLLVFDNAADPERVQPFLPVSGQPHVIITSHWQPVARLGAEVPVEVFTESEALAYLVARTGRSDDPDAQVLAAELGRLPLALAQAAAVIADQRLGYRTYLDRLRALPVAELLAPVEAGQYPRGLAAAVLLSVDGVQAGDDTGECGPVLDVLAVLSPAGVRRTMIHALCRAGFPWQHGSAGGLDGAAADRVLGRLAGASLLTFNVDGASVSVHRLVMRVIRERLAARGCLTVVCATVAQVLDQLAVGLGESWHADRAAVRDLIGQITALSQSSQPRAADDRLARLILRLRLSGLRFLNRLGDSAAQAISIGELLLADMERLLGPDHPDTLASRGGLALAYWTAGRTAEAIALSEQTLADMERLLGPDHPDTLNSRDNLAIAYWTAGRTAEAIALFEQTLADMERLLGSDHPDTLNSRGNLAIAYWTAGRTAEAIALFEQTLADMERLLGPDHPDTLKSRGNLAIAYQDAGRTAEAIALFKQTLADAERLLGFDHPDTLTSRGGLALAYRDAGRTAEAIALFEQTLADAERLLGPDHPITLESRGGLALAYQDAGRTTEAMALDQHSPAKSSDPKPKPSNP